MESRKNYIVPIIDLEKKKKRSNHQNVFGDFEVENRVIKETLMNEVVYKYNDEEYCGGARGRKPKGRYC